MHLVARCGRKRPSLGGSVSRRAFNYWQEVKPCRETLPRSCQVASLRDNGQAGRVKGSGEGSPVRQQYGISKKRAMTMQLERNSTLLHHSTRQHSEESAVA